MFLPFDLFWTTYGSCYCTLTRPLYLDYCNSLYLNLPKSELNHLQGIQNALAHVVADTRRCDHIAPTRQSMHWLKVHERINYKVIPLTYNLLQTAKPTYLSHLLTLQESYSYR